MNKFQTLLVCFLILLLISSIHIAYGQEDMNLLDAECKKQCHWEKRDPQGTLIYTGQFEADLPVGKFTYYYPGGAIKAVSFHTVPGLREKTMIYHQNGKVMAQGNYFETKKDSTWTYYDEEGILISDEHYDKGVRTGTWRTYYLNGSTSEEFYWKQDKKDGPWNQYYSDGSLKLTAFYTDDLRNGDFSLYFPNAQIMVKGQYENDKREGEWKYYMEDGRLQKVRQYSNGYMISEVVYIDIDKEQ